LPKPIGSEELLSSIEFVSLEVQGICRGYYLGNMGS